MRNAKNWLLLNVVSLLFLSHVIGQKHFEPGFIVNLQNDTIKGFIENQNKFKVSTQ